MSMINCIYSPTEKMRVVDDEEYQRLLATGKWFKHPNEAKLAKEKENGLFEKQRLHPKRRKGSSDIEQPPEDGPIPA